MPMTGKIPRHIPMFSMIWITNMAATPVQTKQPNVFSERMATKMIRTTKNMYRQVRR